MMTEPTTAHASFVLERDYRAAPPQVFRAWSDPDAKRRWFAEGEGFTDIAHALDFREGGSEQCSGREPGGRLFVNRTVFHDIVPNRRIVFSYTMALDETRISASLATVELLEIDGGTRLVLTEQAAFFDGADTVDQRRGGWTWLLGRLDAELAGDPQAAG